MPYKQLLVSEKLHRRVKAAAALRGQPIIQFTTDALERQLKEIAPPVLDAAPPKAERSSARDHLTQRCSS